MILAQTLIAALVSFSAVVTDWTAAPITSKVVQLLCTGEEASYRKLNDRRRDFLHRQTNIYSWMSHSLLTDDCLTVSLQSW